MGLKSFAFLGGDKRLTAAPKTFGRECSSRHFFLVSITRPKHRIKDLTKSVGVIHLKLAL